MTQQHATHDYTSSTRDTRDTGDRVDVARGVPTDRVRWGPILAGTFAALTALAVLSTLGAAIGLSTFDRGEDSARNFAMAGGVWGLISMLLAFGFGGWLAARAAAVRGRDNGLLNGFMVAGVGIPLLLFVIGSMGTLMGSAEVANGRDAQATGQSDSGAGAIVASARIGGGADGASAGASGQQSQNAQQEDARRAGSRTAWGTLIGLVVAIGAASAAGAMGARDDHRHDRHATTHTGHGTGA